MGMMEQDLLVSHHRQSNLSLPDFDRLKAHQRESYQPMSFGQ